MLAPLTKSSKRMQHFYSYWFQALRGKALAGFVKIFAHHAIGIQINDLQIVRRRLGNGLHCLPLLLFASSPPGKLAFGTGIKPRNGKGFGK